MSRFAALDDASEQLEAQLAGERTRAAEINNALRVMVGTQGWQEVVLPWMRAFKRVATDACRQPNARSIPGLRDYLDGQCAAYDDLVRQINGMLQESGDAMSLDVEDDEGIYSDIG